MDVGGGAVALHSDAYLIMKFPRDTDQGENARLLEFILKAVKEQDIPHLMVGSLMPTSVIEGQVNAFLLEHLE